MRKFLSVLLLCVTIFTCSFSNSALAAEAAKGAAIFTANCAQCHARGGNIVNRAKTLKKAALEKYGMYSADKIIYQVTKGKGAMPAFGRKLKKDQIENVAAYVLEQADKGWPKK
ncbi:MAG: c-type cytochrome [Gloeotrichia echinulata IR180]|jgi:cytochrome c6|nr:c-type cytochrome [Gloeotrichia echinulata DEX184]